MNSNEKEEKILRLWQEMRAFEKSVEMRPKSREFVFYEGPPTANGRPGIHHVESRAYKDAICRYKTMQGYRVERKGGWDTHGLPVEIEVEKELGLHNKKEIEQYGIAAFNARCKQSVWKYKTEWENLTERVGFWVDMKNPYITYDPLYMESLWWVISEAWKKKLLYKGHKVVPYCPRCGTSLSSHEVAQGYQDVSEDSVFVKFQISNFKFPKKSQIKNSKLKTFILAWTTTPWTLPGNVALAVGENIIYAVIEQNGERYILAQDRLGILQGDYKTLGKLKGKDLVGIEYEPVFDVSDLRSEKSYRVYAADFVTTEDGSGVVHTAVMYGEDDYALGKKLGLPAVHTVDEAGKFNKRVPAWEGIFVKDAEKAIIENLETRGLMYKVERYKHSYPFCWRCKTPLLYYAMDSWFIGMSKLRKELQANNKKINWVPDYLKEGRFGEWLKEAKDWAFSRSRYWGTPLPVWECSECGAQEVVGSRDDLRKQTFSSNTYFVMRHGFSSFNKKDVIATAFPEPQENRLLQRGITEAKKSAKELKKAGGVDYIFSSPFLRTRETAEIVGKELGVPVQDAMELHEVKLGDYNGKAIEDFHKQYPAHERFTKTPQDGETLAQVAFRMKDFIDTLEEKYQDKRILIVTHGDPLWMLESMMLGRTQDEMATVKMDGEGYPPTGGLRKLSYTSFPYNHELELDFHRPYVDEISFRCKKCKKGQQENTMHRVKDLVDVWFDSGSMPFAQAHFPFEKNAAKLLYPADYICEAIDQTRGWFYTLLAVATVLGKGNPYKNVISVGHVLDKKGEKMSKSKGNTVDPWSITEKYGADALRWYFYTINDAGDVKRFDENDVRQTANKFVGTLENSFAFYKTYTTGMKVARKAVAATLLDKWVLARWEEVKAQVIEALDSYHIMQATRALDYFVLEDLSNWYVRRSRRRFQKPKNLKEKQDAASVLLYLLQDACKVAAPFVPFTAESIFQELTGAKAKTSVHWQRYPQAKKLTTGQNTLLEEMNIARAIVKEGLRLRSDAGIRVRQVLQRFVVFTEFKEEICTLIAEELNVKEVLARGKNGKGKDLLKEFPGATLDPGKVEGIDVALDSTLTPALLSEGFVKEIMRHVQDLRKDAGLRPADSIEMYFYIPNEHELLPASWQQEVQREVRAKVLHASTSPNAKDASSSISFFWQGKEVWLGIKKLKK